MSLAFPTETEMSPPERRARRLPFDVADAAIVGGVVIGAVSLAAIWLPMAGIFLATALILLGLRAG